MEQMPPKKKFRSGRSKKRRFAGNRYTVKKEKRRTRLQLIKNQPKKPKVPIPKKASGVWVLMPPKWNLSRLLWANWMKFLVNQIAAQAKDITKDPTVFVWLTFLCFQQSSFILMSCLQAWLCRVARRQWCQDGFCFAFCIEVQEPKVQVLWKMLLFLKNRREPSIRGKQEDSFGHKKCWYWLPSTRKIYFCHEHAPSNEWKFLETMLLSWGVLHRLSVSKALTIDCLVSCDGSSTDFPRTMDVLLWSPSTLSSF